MSESFASMGLFLILLRGSISSLVTLSYLLILSLLLFPPFLSSFTLSAYLKVFRVFSQLPDPGAILPIIKVLQKPVKESLSTMVSLLPLKGVCDLP